MKLGAPESGGLLKRMAAGPAAGAIYWCKAFEVAPFAARAEAPTNASHGIEPSWFLGPGISRCLVPAALAARKERARARPSGRPAHKCEQKNALQRAA